MVMDVGKIQLVGQHAKGAKRVVSQLIDHKNSVQCPHWSNPWKVFSTASLGMWNVAQSNGCCQKIHRAEAAANCTDGHSSCTRASDDLRSTTERSLCWQVHITG